ncbi:hypothetical protein ACFE04_012399 [Oxalis oulophora]
MIEDNNGELILIIILRDKDAEPKEDTLRLIAPSERVALRPKLKRAIKSFDTTIDSTTKLWFRTFITTTSDKLPVIFYFHGGGFMSMQANSKNYHEFCHRLAKCVPATVISVNYRLSPEYKYPIQYEDGFEALKFVDDSNSNGFQLPENALFPEGEDRDHPAANVFGPRSEEISRVDNFPDTLLFVGGCDMLQDWQRRYYEGLKIAGKEVRLVEYPNAIHGFYAFPKLPESSLLMNEVKEIVESKLRIIK